jgi:hypothetical protein
MHRCIDAMKKIFREDRKNDDGGALKRSDRRFIGLIAVSSRSHLDLASSSSRSSTTLAWASSASKRRRACDFDAPAMLMHE